MAEISIDARGEGNSLRVSISYPSNFQQPYNFLLSIEVHEQDLATRIDRQVYTQTFHTLQRELLIQDLSFSKLYKLIVKNSYGLLPPKQKIVSAFTTANREPLDGPIDGLIDAPIDGPIDGLIDEQRQSSERGSISSSQPDLTTINQRPNGARGTFSRKKEGVKTRLYNKDSELSNSQLLMKTLGHGCGLGSKDKIHKLLLNGRNCRDLNQFMSQKKTQQESREEALKRQALVIKGKVLFSDIYKCREGLRYFRNDWHMGPFYSYDPNERQIKRM